MKIGGYQIIDLKGKNLTTDVGMVYEGIYDLIESTRKPILLSGIQVDDTEYQDVFTSVTINGSAFELKAYNKIFTIEDTDVVTVSNDSNGGSVDGGVVEFALHLQDDYIEKHIALEAPANKTWRECIINNLIKVKNLEEIDDLIISIRVGSNYNVETVVLGQYQYVYIKFEHADTNEPIYASLYDSDNNVVKDRDIISENTYTNFMLV